jgi:hypothetical protein
MHTGTPAMDSNQGHKRGQEQEQTLFRVAKRREPRLGGTPAKPQGQGDGRRVHARPTTWAWHSRLQLSRGGVHTVCRHSHVHIQRADALRASMLVEKATGGRGPMGRHGGRLHHVMQLGCTCEPGGGGREGRWHVRGASWHARHGAVLETCNRACYVSEWHRLMHAV